MLPFRPFQHLLSVEDQIATLESVHRLLEQYSEVELTYYVRSMDGGTARLVQAFPMRWFWPQEMEHLLARCGLRVKSVYGNFDRSSLTDASPDMIFVAERI